MNDRSGYNSLRLIAFPPGSTTAISGAGLERAAALVSSTQYPGGLFGTLTFFLPWPAAIPWTVKLHDRMTAWNKLRMVWEGEVVGLSYAFRRGEQGLNVTCYGYWSTLLMERRWRKPWADTRIGDQYWPYQTNTNAAEKCNIDRNNRIRFTPKAEAWSVNQFAQVTYTAPTGETIKRLTFNYDLQEAAQQWVLALWNVTSGAAVWSVTASGTGSVDHTLATPATAVNIYFQAAANQTPPSDGTIYGQVSSVVVYTETGSINLTEITKDTRAKVTEFSAYEGEIDSNTLSLVPFISENETLADMLTRAASYGDSSYNAWAVGVRESTLGADGKPVLFVEQQPALTSADYVLALGEQQADWERNIIDVRNWVAVRYRDPDGGEVYATPDDDANLRDDASITAYGRREEWLDLDTTSVTTAKNYARRVLAARKDPQWMAAGGIPVIGYINDAAGGIVPASEIRAGTRVRISNFLGDLSGAGLTLLITQTDYDDDSETCLLSVGRPDSLAVWLARQDAQIGV